MRVRLEKDGATITLDGEPFARGGEAALWAPPSLAGLLAKVYLEPTPERGDKLAAMLANRPDDPTAKQNHTSIAWPAQRLLGDDGRPVGFLMPRVENARSLFDVYNPKSRLQTWPLFHYGYLVRTARNLAIAVRALHARGYVLGDLNESNVLVNAQTLVTVVDTDSFQVRAGQRVFRCVVGKPEYAAPEIQGADFKTIDRTPEQDHFALAVLIFQLLMQGTHPFAGRFTGVGEPEVPARRIAAGHWPYARKPRGPYEPNPTAPPFVVLPFPVRELMRQCFEDGHDRPASRPDAGDWHRALAEADAELMDCVANGQHRFHKSLDACPWCELKERQGRDPFPSREQVKARAEPAVAPTAMTKSKPPPLPAPAAAKPNPAARTPRAVRPRRPAPAWLRTLLTPWPWVIGVASVGLVVLVYMIVTNAHRPSSSPADPTPAVANRTNPIDVPAGRDPNQVHKDGPADDDLGPMGKPADPMGKKDSGATDVTPPPDRPPDPPPPPIPPPPPPDTPDGQRAIFDQLADQANSVAFSPDGRDVVAGCADGQVYLWDPETGDSTVCKEAHTGGVRCVAFSADGRLAASGGDDGVTRLWNAKDGSQQREFPGPAFPVLFLTFSKAAGTLQTGYASSDPSLDLDGRTDGMFRVWRTGGVEADNYEIRRFKGPGDVLTCMAFLPRQQSVLYVGVDPNALTPQLVVWGLLNRKETKIIPAGDLGVVQAVAVSPVGDKAVTAGDDDDVRLWNLPTSKEQFRLKGHGGTVWCAAFSPTGDRILTGDNDGTVWLWDANTGKEIRRFTGHGGAVHAVAFSADGARAVSGGADRTLRVWELPK